MLPLRTSQQNDVTDQVDSSTSQTDGARSRHFKSAATSGNTDELEGANCPFPSTNPRHPQLKKPGIVNSRRSPSEVMASHRVPDIPLNFRKSKVAVPCSKQLVLKEAEEALEFVKLSMARRDRDYALHVPGSSVRHI